MISAEQRLTLEENAYVPEHVIDYVTSISGAEPFLFGDFLAYRKEANLIFVGYPLRDAFKERTMKKALDEAIRRFNPTRVVLTAPSIPSSIRPVTILSTDRYYRLELPALPLPPKVRNMINRAGRVLKVEKRKILNEEHAGLIRQFLKTHPVRRETQFIFERVPDYLSSSGAAWAFDARDEGGDLVAFDVAEMGPGAYAFYMFNFTSRSRFVPGASDLLLWQIIRHAQAEDKHYINLGLGIDRGVTFFKEKWGGKPFLPYAFADHAPADVGGLEALLQKL